MKAEEKEESSMLDQLYTLMDTKKESVLTKSMMRKGVHMPIFLHTLVIELYVVKWHECTLIMLLTP